MVQFLKVRVNGNQKNFESNCKKRSETRQLNKNTLTMDEVPNELLKKEHLQPNYTCLPFMLHV